MSTIKLRGCYLPVCVFWQVLDNHVTIVCLLLYRSLSNFWNWFPSQAARQKMNYFVFVTLSIKQKKLTVNIKMYGSHGCLN